jgi:D-beta-D-heptose 7-phosphate kinase/D-beta-D-heptose 1-phosphate adenosyltransferase
MVASATAPGMAGNVQLNLLELGIVSEYIRSPTEILKTRYIDQRSGQQLLRVDTEPMVITWDSRTAQPMDAYDAVIISDYNKGFLSYEDIERLIAFASCPVFIDTKKPDLKRFAGAYVKINDLEFKNRTSDHDKLIVTMGNQGAMYNGKLYPTTKLTVTDVCGCGDTFLAALAFQYLLTEDIESAIMFANLAAGITVQHRGNYAPTYNEISHACLLK